MKVTLVHLLFVHTSKGGGYLFGTFEGAPRGSSKICNQKFYSCCYNPKNNPNVNPNKEKIQKKWSRPGC